MTRRRSKQVQSRSMQQTLAQEREAAEREEQDQAHKRSLFAALEFWRGCERSACRRSRACRGDFDDCWYRSWRSVSEEDRSWFHAAIKARVAGMTADDAIKHADAELARTAEISARCFGAGGGEQAATTRDPAADSAES